MEELLNKLYNYEYFGIYLIISIIILVLLFIIILFFGNKDKKEREIEATKKLQQINNDAFKEDSLGEKLELSQETLENDTIIVPSIENVSGMTATSDNEIPEPVLPVQEEVVSEEKIQLYWDGDIIKSGSGFGFHGGTIEMKVFIENEPVSDFTINNENDKICVCEKGEENTLYVKALSVGESKFMISA